MTSRRAHEPEGRTADGPPADATGVEEDLTPEALVEQWEEEAPPAAGPLANLGAAVVVVVLGALGVVGSVSLGVGSLDEPRPGSWPLAVSVALVALGVALAVQARTPSGAEQFGSQSLAVVAGLLTMIPFALLIGVIGFEIPAALLAFVWLRFLGRESWRTSVVGSVLMVAAFYAIFVLALGVSIPHLF